MSSRIEGIWGKNTCPMDETEQQYGHELQPIGTQPVSRAILFGQHGEDGAMELRLDGHCVGENVLVD